jgi:hypothetical protein
MSVAYSPDDAPRLTQAMQTLREQISESTDGYVFAPWTCLEQAEKEDTVGIGSPKQERS